MRENKFRFRLKQLTKNGYEEWFEYSTLDELISGALITTAEIIGKDQYTNRKDKNGKEVYEGDIVKVYGDKIGTVVFNEDCAAYHIDYVCTWIPYDECEIIGNIYENSSLLD